MAKGKHVDLVGRQFGRLTVLSKTSKREQGNIIWDCLCECGKHTKVATHHLTKGAVKSCGCFNSEGYEKFNEEVRDLGTKKLDSARVDGTTLYAMDMKKPTTNTTGHKGVSKGTRKKYRVTLTSKGKQYHGGEYDDLDEAVKARERLEDKIYGELKERYKDHDFFKGK